MANCIGTGFLQFSCALVQMRYSIGENSCGHVIRGGGGFWQKDSDGKGIREQRRKGEKGKRGWGYVKGNSRTGGTTNKKK